MRAGLTFLTCGHRSLAVHLAGSVGVNSYEAFTADITDAVTSGDNELMVHVYDPSDEGFQPNGKQRISAITMPGGDTYTPSSGIWQTVRPRRR